MSSRYPIDPFARPDRPEIPLSRGPDRFGPEGRVRFAQRLRRVVTSCAVWAGATAALSILVFLPVLAGEISQIDAVGISGRTYSAQAFVDRLQGLFLGSSIVALALVCFVASAALAARSQSGFRQTGDGPATPGFGYSSGGFDPLTLNEKFNV